MSNDVVIFEFSGTGERETAIDLPTLVSITNQFAAIVIAAHFGRIHRVQFALVGARQGSLRIDLRPVIKFTKEHGGEIATVTSVLALAVAVLDLTGCGQRVETAPAPAKIQIELDGKIRSQCENFAEQVEKSGKGSLTIILPDGETLCMDPDSEEYRQEPPRLVINDEQKAFEMMSELPEFRMTTSVENGKRTVQLWRGTSPERLEEIITMTGAERWTGNS